MPCNMWPRVSSQWLQEALPGSMDLWSRLPTQQWWVCAWWPVWLQVPKQKSWRGRELSVTRLPSEMHLLWQWQCKQHFTHLTHFTLPLRCSKNVTISLGDLWGTLMRAFWEVCAGQGCSSMSTTGKCNLHNRWWSTLQNLWWHHLWLPRHLHLHRSQIVPLWRHTAQKLLCRSREREVVVYKGTKFVCSQACCREGVWLHPDPQKEPTWNNHGN